MRQNNKAMWSQANVVGIVDSQRAIARAKKLRGGDVDLLEWRADCLPDLVPPIIREVPWILTVRHPREGGQGGLSSMGRRKVFLDLLEHAGAVDIECRSLGALRCVVDAARAGGVGVIASFHDFQNTPSSNRLEAAIQIAIDGGADLVKIATQTESAREVGRLLALFDRPPLPLAVMGMGRLGMASRLLFASCGSVLNYGWIDQPNVAGQWSAVDLRLMLAKTLELGASASE
jgi:3-dehydroquinate dehydratase-1